jgi:hypothetical protein
MNGCGSILDPGLPGIRGILVGAIISIRIAIGIPVPYQGERHTITVGMKPWERKEGKIQESCESIDFSNVITLVTMSYLQLNSNFNENCASNLFFSADQALDEFKAALTPA